MALLLLLNLIDKFGRTFGDYLMYSHACIKGIGEQPHPLSSLENGEKTEILRKYLFGR